METLPEKLEWIDAKQTQPTPYKKVDTGIRQSRVSDYVAVLCSGAPKIRIARYAFDIEKRCFYWQDWYGDPLGKTLKAWFPIPNGPEVLMRAERE